MPSSPYSPRLKEQDKAITELRAEVAELHSQFSDLKSGQQPRDLQGFRLDQNAPNPTGGTTIGYALPTGPVGALITIGRQTQQYSDSAVEVHSHLGGEGRYFCLILTFPPKLTQLHPKCPVLVH